MENYIGKKGYTVIKENYTLSEIQNVRDEMNVKPNNSINGFITQIHILYRESI